MTEEFTDPNAVPSLLSAPARVAFSIVTFGDGWPEDFVRLANGLSAHCAHLDYELVAVSNASDDLRAAAEHVGARVVDFKQRIGFGAGRNAGILQALGEVVVIADTSIEPVGDFLSPLGAALADRSIGMAGAWGLVTDDMRSFEEATGSEVDALQAYCMAFRRADVAAPDRRADVETVGMFDPKYKFYRNADIDFSMRWRAANYKIVALELPLLRHTHHEWESLSETEREKKSRDNFARFLRSWGGYGQTSGSRRDE